LERQINSEEISDKEINKKNTT